MYEIMRVCKRILSITIHDSSKTVNLQKKNLPRIIPEKVLEEDVDGDYSVTTFTSFILSPCFTPSMNSMPLVTLPNTV